MKDSRLDLVELYVKVSDLCKRKGRKSKLYMSEMIMIYGRYLRKGVKEVFRKK
jgi:hypothetical protein